MKELVKYFVLCVLLVAGGYILSTLFSGDFVSHLVSVFVGALAVFVFKK